MKFRLKEKVINNSFYIFVVLFSILLPVALSLPALSTFVGAQHKISKMNEFFGLSGFLVVLFIVVWTIKQNRPSNVYGYMKILLPALIALVWLNVLTERTIRDWDYICYEHAAQFLLDGQNPYQECYYYPPFLVLVFSSAYTFIQNAVIAMRGFPIEYDRAWVFIFYLYQCMQWYLILLAFYFSIRLAEKFGLQKYLSFGVVTLLFTLNNPLLRTLNFFQINLWILNIILFVLLYSTSHPFISGFLAALGTHLKLYPVVFIAPWSLLKNKWALSGFAVGITAFLILIQISFGNGTIWLQFVNQDPSNAGGHALRDNSFHSLIYNLLRITNLISPEDLNNKIPETLTTFIVFLVAVWFLVRMIFRYRMLKMNNGFDTPYLSERDGLFVDMVGLMLLVSPVAWEHHYVLAIPVILWTFAFQIKEKQLPVSSLLAFLLIFALPTFDVFPFSYLRLFGLLILLNRSDPIRYFRRNQNYEEAKTTYS